MDSEESKRTLDILDGAHGLSEKELESYLDRVCGDNSLLRREVLGYLDYDVEHTVISVGTDGKAVLELPVTPVSDRRYELGEEIASGGVGIILRAYDNNIRRRIAIKVLRSKWENDPDVIRRLVQEAQIAGQLQHPGIAPVYEIGRLPDQRLFIAMKLVKGSTLAELLDRRQDAADDQAKFLGIFEQVCQAIAFAHRRGVIHRDLKPGNVMVGEFGEVQVMDWGIAKVLDDEQGQPSENDHRDRPDGSESGPEVVETDGSGHSTRIGEAMGTPAYMAPEQCIGRATKASDVFALGAILCEILTGEKPGDSLDAVGEQLDRCSCDPELVELARSCLDKKEAARPADAGAVANRISAYLASIQSRLKEAEIAAARGEVKAQEERKRRHRTRWAIAAVGILLAVIGLVGLYVRNAVVEQQQAARADGLVDQLLVADIQQVPAILGEIEACRRRVAARLSLEFEQSEPGSVERLHAALAFPADDDRKLEYLRDHLVKATSTQFPVVRAALLPQKDQFTEFFWRLVQNEENDANARFQAAAALAEYAPDDKRWIDVAPLVADHLTGAIAYGDFGHWLFHLQGARQHLTDPLAGILADRSRAERQRGLAASALADYWRDQPEQIAHLILIAHEQAEFAPLLDALKPHRRTVEQALTNEMLSPMPEELSTPQRDAKWQRKSLAAVALVQLGHGDGAWSLLRLTPDPSLRSMIIYHLGRLQTDHNTLAERLTVEADASIHRALIQSLGGLDPMRIPTADRIRIAAQLRTIYANDNDPGVHSSASWTLRQWAATLPELPIGQPLVSETQHQRIAELTTLCRVAWERQLREQLQGMSPKFTSGLVARCPLGEAQSTHTADTNARQQRGAYQGPGQPNWAPGVVGDALQLHGGGSPVNCGSEFNPERTDEFSYGCWFYVAPGSGNTRLLSKMGPTAEGTHGGFNVYINGDRLVAGWIHKFPEDRLAIVAIDDRLLGRWRHVFISYSGSATAASVRLYMDGQLIPFKVAADSLTKTIRNTEPLKIGVQPPGSSSQCRIDDLRIYNRQLDRDEVQELYKYGLSALASVPPGDRTTDQQALLDAAFDCAVHGPGAQASQGRFSLTKKALLEEWEKLRRWYVNSQGQTMMIISNPTTSDRAGIAYDFAIASHEVTVAQFQRFRNEHEVSKLVAPSDDCPVHHVTWDLAAEYCNWLSEQEAIPQDQWAYEPKTDDPANGMISKNNYLELSGYRLPTSAEWTRACRAGTRGTFGFGESLLLLRRYAQRGSSRSLAVGSLLPNDAGLFNMHGNVWEMCHDRVTDTLWTLRGGSYLTSRREPGSSYKITSLRDTLLDCTGFRVARTHR